MVNILKQFNFSERCSINSIFRFCSVPKFDLKVKRSAYWWDDMNTTVLYVECNVDQDDRHTFLIATKSFDSLSLAL